MKWYIQSLATLFSGAEEENKIPMQQKETKIKPVYKIGNKERIQESERGIFRQLYPCQSVNYLGIKVDQNLNWKYHINDIEVKVNRANAFLFKIGNIVNITILKPSTLQYLIKEICLGLRIEML